MEIKQCLAACLVAALTCAIADTLTEDELTEMIKDGFRNVERETINGQVILEDGYIPTWLSGNFMRHACGAFGETDNMNKTLPNYIEHLFDCIEIGNKFRIENGNITFTNRWYDTTVNDIYNFYGREMNESSLFHTTTLSKLNPTQLDIWSANLSDNSKLEKVHHVSWWQIGDDVIAMSEFPIGVIIDPDEVAHKGYIQYNDDNLGVPNSMQYFTNNNPAHEHTEPDGTLWSAVAVIKFETRTLLKSWRVVYKVGADKIRHVIGTYHYEDTDVTKCRPGTPYEDFTARFGYLHSFAMTENYIILPETAYMIDTCVFAFYNKYEPFFSQGFHYEPSGLSRLLVMRKSDGVFVANITVPPIFITHQLGAYEDGDSIHMDMLTYNDAGIYTQHLYVENLFNKHTYTSNVTRITIHMSNWTASLRSLREPRKPPAAFEMSNINYKYNAKKYTYAYMARNFAMKDQNALTKLNVDTGEEIEYLYPKGMFTQEPQFVSRPNAVSEDDGVLLAQGVDGRKHKAFMVIVDAKTMKLIGHVTAPDLALFGLHNKLFPFHKGNSSGSDSKLSSGSSKIEPFSCKLYMFVFICVFMRVCHISI
ncbi:carotenoid isomerooxygenase-like [Mercenaria mercenaria]|uniref:carotenoid isomerooxygenase-like n=1 Tax=Mercenaria mercenaria TaxID=6596 RepID=UPI001E1D6E9B|nr:carotenoid isomerooxygenase-like [Mercenaria mercenaria]XP_045181135.1 carotenoid isomerooxygenase-like [Mercenaria mercenaria]